jgi:phosphoribosyl-ATP pyrophosphohydrolase
MQMAGCHDGRRERALDSRHHAHPTHPPEGKPSWTARLLADPVLLCKKVREEAGELCETLEAGEGAERAASEMADLLYHSMVLLNLQVRRTFGGWCMGESGGCTLHGVA